MLGGVGSVDVRLSAPTVVSASGSSPAGGYSCARNMRVASGSAYRRWIDWNSVDALAPGKSQRALPPRGANNVSPTNTALPT